MYSKPRPDPNTTTVVGKISRSWLKIEKVSSDMKNKLGLVSVFNQKHDLPLTSNKSFSFSQNLAAWQTRNTTLMCSIKKQFSVMTFPDTLSEFQGFSFSFLKCTCEAFSVGSRCFKNSISMNMSQHHNNKSLDFHTFIAGKRNQHST